ncbi:hypothetical protein A2627_04735 [Candidatus Woesebacteria bacterium RIFCSPHIGHO2_01_FULL_39_28]|uniref:Aconitase/3-isopropylmalate dehydratase large subunit alpha/beta/alpha domain-containing protein n=1 Tax=Candidatus Woesebacteria bacterium RIFCSPHIGHO2_01_FULL_39_28 TaxID=1802496 RepID=A0A1F7YBC7_9BACT|nr:MAG: hypothetical protein A2627_04735 [Candidatus Woesebacteria bacterium RIFCSPHIGHO2_01_FULL_39_28]OGM58437.1 MAG: hypothetical protein A3A50_01010 [Candidatus Woesebacteria bacterium RIFCSPLOWO2_01_FULL_38_20]
MFVHETEMGTESRREVLALFEEGYSDLLKRQIDGERILFLGPEDTKRLMSGISTDGILPTKGGRYHNPEDLAEFALSGIPGIPEGAIKNGNIGTLLVGGRFAGGSAREHAVLTLKGAGVGTILVVGGKAGRIFKENCLYANGPTVEEVEADLDTVNRRLSEIREGSNIKLEERYPDPLKQLIQECGGLYNFTIRRLNQEFSLPIISHQELSCDHPMTATEKILAKKGLNVDPKKRIVKPGDLVLAETDLRFAYELHTPKIEADLKRHFGEGALSLIKDRKSIVLFEDHSVLDPLGRFTHLINSQRGIAERTGIQLFRQEDSSQGSVGICHTLIVENGLLLPGQFGAGSDSHTPHAGVLGALAIGFGATAIGNAFVTKDIPIEVPETARVTLKGKLPKGCAAKDAMLSILADPWVRDGHANGTVLEFVGDGLSEWSVDGLAVLTNMSAEADATSGIITEPNEALLSHLTAVTGMSKDEIEKMFIRSDPNAKFVHEIEVILDQIEPMVATPGHATNAIPISKLGRVQITGAYVGSCTGGNFSDIRQVAEVINNKTATVPLFVQCASLSIYQRAKNAGLIDIIAHAGGNVLPPGCGACCGMGPGGVVNPHDVIITDTNRNSPGRTGKPIVGGEEVDGGSVYLASPCVVAASSVKGYIFDPRNLEN